MIRACGHVGLGHEPFMAVLELPKARIILRITAHSLSQPCLIAKAYVYQTVYLYTVSVHPPIRAFPSKYEIHSQRRNLGGMYRNVWNPFFLGANVGISWGRGIRVSIHSSLSFSSSISFCIYHRSSRWQMIGLAYLCPHSSTNLLVQL